MEKGDRGRLCTLPTLKGRRKSTKKRELKYVGCAEKLERARKHLPWSFGRKTALPTP